MAPKTLVVALLFFAVVGLAATVGHATPAAAAGGHATPAAAAGGHATPAAAAPADHQGDASEVGNVGGSDDAAPVGSPVSEGTFSPVTTTDGAPGPSASKADASEVSAAASFAAAVAAAAFF